jgi:NTE family protein
MNYRAFVAFSGGGAKGIVHVGALKALENKNVKINGFAGTSAGAIVACLAAAGFKADALLDSNKGSSIFEELSRIDPRLKRATSLFGTGGWIKIRICRALLRIPYLSHTLLIVLFLIPSIAAMLLLQFWPDWLFWGISGSLIVTLTIVILIYRTALGGLADVCCFREALAKLLQQKMFPGEPSHMVLMRDFDGTDFPKLKIVSANLTSQALQLFSAERSPEIPAADAVAASICLPLIFKPWQILGNHYVDGGIVSNLPAWPFDEEREIDPEALTISVSVESPSQITPIGNFNWLFSAVQTALFGSAELNTRIAGRSEHLILPTGFNLLDFDATPERAAQEVRDVAAATSIRLDKRLFRLPEIYQDACRVTQSIAIDALGIPNVDGKTSKRIRVGVARLERGYTQSLRFSHNVGYERDTDEGILIPIEGTVAGAAWRDRQSVIEKQPFEASRDLPGGHNRLRKKQRWKAMKWMMCIPILDTDTASPRLLIQIDGNMELEDNAATVAALSVVEEAIKDFFNLILAELRSIEDDDDIKQHDISD